jgi:hypothetical protein
VEWHALSITVDRLTVVFCMTVRAVVRMMMRGWTFPVGRGNGLGRSQDEPAGLDSLGADQLLGEVSDLPGGPAQQDDFQTTALVEVNVGGGDDLVEMVVL